MTAVYNAANEEAAEAFLAGRIGFPAIVRTIADVLSAADQWAAQPATVEDVLDAQRWARSKARRLIERSHRRFYQLDDVRYRHRAVRARHPDLGGAA